MIISNKHNLREINLVWRMSDHIKYTVCTVQTTRQLHQIKKIYFSDEETYRLFEAYIHVSLVMGIVHY